MINTVTIAGNLTRDAEYFVTKNGGKILKGGIAVNERVKDGDTWADRPNYIDWALFGERAEKLEQYLKRGTKVCMVGRLRYESWEDRDGNKRSKLTVIANDVEFMTPRGDSAQPAKPGAFSDSDIPF